MEIKGQAPSKGAGGVFAAIARYYAEFLSTDFKSTRLPKRSIKNKDRKGRLIGIPTKKYPGFQLKLWQWMTDRYEFSKTIKITRNLYKSTMPTLLKQVIKTEVDSTDGEYFRAIVITEINAFKGLAKAPNADVILFREGFLERVRHHLNDQIIQPLLYRLDAHLQGNEHKPVESMLEIQDGLTDILLGGFAESSGEAISELFVHLSDTSLNASVDDFFNDDTLKAALTSYFSDFASGDLFVDFSEVLQTQDLTENSDIYLYIGEIHVKNNVFPMFSLPLEVDVVGREIQVKFSPNIYINKQAMDFTLQEVTKANGGTSSPSIVKDRLLFVEEGVPILDYLQPTVDKLALACNVRADLSFEDQVARRVNSTIVSLSNQVSIGLFDKSEESIVNDYEAILTGIDSGDDVVSFFTDMVKSFLMTNPVSVNREVDDDWEATSVPDRLVFDCPLPLAEEQRKIRNALQKADAKFIAVEGPPGTGKSHTITAIAFDAIMSGKSLLVLSDKKEALDVVEDKLNGVINKVRGSQNLVNPILRLGKSGSNYRSLLKKSNISELETTLKVQRSYASKFDDELNELSASLKQDIETSSELFSAIDMPLLTALHKEESELLRRYTELGENFEKEEFQLLLQQFESADQAVIEYKEYFERVVRSYGNGVDDALAFVDAHRLLISDGDALRRFRKDDISLMTKPSPSYDALKTMSSILRTLEASKGIFGWLFASTAVNQAKFDLEDTLGIMVAKPHKELVRLKALNTYVKAFIDLVDQHAIQHSFVPVLWQMISTNTRLPSVEAIEKLNLLNAAFKQQSLPSMSLLADLLSPQNEYIESLRSFASLQQKFSDIAEKFDKIPDIDYLGTKTEIERLNTAKLAEKMDRRLVDFYYEKKADAKVLGDIISKKAKFPTEKFGDLIHAFPCIIAGLRDYAEFIPLERNLFDLVIIDEASQVSIAQALPAVIRAKKMIVLGDRRQFGNVKTTNASKELNNAYLQRLRQTFEEEMPDMPADMKERIEYFDIRKSVMDFFELTSNYTIQLSKHFRSYPEMISFSSKHFYQNSLQAVKIRGINIADVIEFAPIEHDGAVETYKNTNELEISYILNQLVEMLDNDHPHTVGIITPHTEQQGLISSRVMEHDRSNEFFEQLKLKVMTFDSCQGEERDTIFYSLVASKERDRLAYIFPKSLDGNTGEDIDHNLRLQRLNVGFSRAKERIVIVHSKPLEEYSSALRLVLKHYKQVLENAGKMPSIDEVDANSPMEAKVLNWLRQLPLLDELGDRAEVLAQFEMGKYLKSLDPTYDHPDYRVDFLIRIAGDDGLHQLVLEYDGFEFHFDQASKRDINKYNWQHYLTDADIEREKILESFGVKMIRLNRFNTAKDPIQTLDKLLRDRLNDLEVSDLGSATVHQMSQTAADISNKLKDGSMKECKKCGKFRPSGDFKSRTAKSGIARTCRHCRGDQRQRFRWG